MRKLLIVAAILSSLGCGLGTSTASCNFPNDNHCQERVNTLDVTGFKATCSAGQGTPADGLCSRTDAIGGCMIGKQGDGSEVVDWYYKPKTEADVRTTCEREPGEFRSP